MQICLRLEAAGADELFIMDLSYDDASHDGAISVIREIGRETDLPLDVGGNIKRVEDVKIPVRRRKKSCSRYLG